ncbi:sulfurtransferase TusA family protein [Shewanella sp. NIFS-20-20]|uniref:sulfurtransferase TusA family protein n=1 Tax=Shewanella sp. NIFS-20-20 TaxID=2853806 RepID=UPI001C457762|nr:sulfurtransferase TusA family protein [Shewanella sp. NIFS-20-20]MBV7317513.1 sulfurtransferase TusA family protein [Shewanella sp. NIFS-20-20]
MEFIDLTGHRCPYPLVKVKMAIKALPTGQQLQVILSDKQSCRDVPEYIKKQGHVVRTAPTQLGHLAVWITKT